MKLVWFILIATLLSGCISAPPIAPPGFMSYEEFQKLPRKWEAPTLYLRLPNEVKDGDKSIEYAVALCKEFAIRIYDATDGQVYVPRFVICNPSVVHERDEGMCNLFVNKGVTIYKNEAYVSHNPIQHPGRFYCQIPLDAGEINACAGIMLHEWLHTFVGLGDEYKHAQELGNIPTTSCPLAESKESCVMTESRVRRELCRPENHNPDTDQGKESCYAKLSRLMFENRLAYISIPTKTIAGPFDPPTPKIEIRLK